MSTEESKALAQRFFAEVLNQQKQGTATEIIAPNFVAHLPAFPQGIHGPEGMNALVNGFRDAFPDLVYTPEDMIAESDKVVVRWTVRGTQLGEFQGLPPTGKQIAVTGIDILRLAGGKVAEAWVNSDFLGMLQQLGAIPTPGQAEG